MNKTLLLGLAMLPACLYAQQTDSLNNHTLEEMSITFKRPSLSRLSGAENGVNMGRAELFKAACCSLGESFVTNPSVDVSYSDASTGAKQIKLLGLNGTYVQMLTENLPAFGGIAQPYALDYVPGAWMKNISVSKGAASVKNGAESITGQINIDYLKPEDPQGATLNLYGNSMGMLDANADANLHLTHHLSTEILAHYNQDFWEHDANGDHFMDEPCRQQLNLQNRWHYAKDNYIFHGGAGLLSDRRDGGQMDHLPLPYTTHVAAHRYEAYMKHALVLDPTHGTNIALLANATAGNIDGHFIQRDYIADQQNLFTQLLWETHLNDTHALSLGLSTAYDHLNEQALLIPTAALAALPQWQEWVYGAHAQYTFTPTYKLTLMAGLRGDISSQYGFALTPRMHLKLLPTDWLTLRMAAGKGYRTPHALAEYHYLLASGRTLLIDSMEREEAWNMGLSAHLSLPIGERSLAVNAEYYYTTFQHQTLVDYDSDPLQIHLANLEGKSYSHTFQIDVSYPLIEDLEATIAYRKNNVQSTYNGVLMEKPLTPRYRALLTLSYKPYMALWQFDATLQLNGNGRMPTPYLLSDGTPAWQEAFPAYFQLNMQVTRRFRHFSLYVGGENLTNYRQPVPVLNADTPWSDTFEPTLLWGPLRGIMVYAGIRLNLGEHVE